MKQFFKMFFASLLAMIIGGVVMVALLIGSLVGLATKMATSATSASEQSTIKDNSILVIDLGKSFHEQGENNSLPMLGSGEGSAAGVYEIGRALQAAAADDKIKGILIRLSASPNSWATLQQIRQDLIGFKKSRKFIYAYGESITQGALFVAAAADSIFLNPVGDIELKGLSSSMPFFKNTLNKLELEPEIFYAGRFKSATEPFRADRMSEPNRVQIAAMQAGIWKEFLDAVAAHAHTDTATIHQLAVAGSIQFPGDALAHQLIDGVRYWDEVEAMMKKKLSVASDKDLNLPDIGEYYSSPDVRNPSKNNRIAILFAEGQIMDGSTASDYQIASENMTKAIRLIRNDDKIKAVVLRVNSPGGSARASEIILRELNLLREKKPVVVSMGDVAASGGYYISCQADSVFAMPTTITGSIGVFTMMFNGEKLLNNKLGITFDQVKNAPYADFPTPTRKMTAEETVLMQRSVDSVYALFKRRVAQGRKITEVNVDSIAQGRIWTGTDALAIGLVDGLGDLDRALKSAAALAKIGDYQIKTYPEKVDRIKSLVKMVTQNVSVGSAIEQSLKRELGGTYSSLAQLKQWQAMNGRCMMLMPFEIITR